MAGKLEQAAKAQERIVEAVRGVVTSDDWIGWLSIAKCFHRYSVNNMFLIFAQAPHASTVAGYRQWQKLGRQVRRGEKGIAILCPVVKTIEETDGEGTHPVVVGFTTGTVFDISQTDGDELPERPMPKILDGEVDAELIVGVVEEIGSRGFCVSFGSPGGQANGSTDFTARSVTIREGLPSAQRFKTLLHELAHIDLGHDTRRSQITRSVAEVEAESVAFIVASSFGCDATGYTIPYVTDWAGGNVDLVVATGQMVVATSSALSGSLSSRLGELAA